MSESAVWDMNYWLGKHRVRGTGPVNKESVNNLWSTSPKSRCRYVVFEESWKSKRLDWNGRLCAVELGSLRKYLKIYKENILAQL